VEWLLCFALLCFALLCFALLCYAPASRLTVVAFRDLSLLSENSVLVLLEVVDLSACILCSDACCLSEVLNAEFRLKVPG
jgi:hypothetical protein